MTNPITRRFPALRAWHSGFLLMIVGAVAVFAGLVQTTLSHGGNQNCPTGTLLVAKFDYSGGRYVFAGPDQNKLVVTLTNGTASGADWHSTIAIADIIVKGGPGAVVISLNPPQTGGHFSNSGLPKVGSGNTPAVSNVQFCGPSTPPTTSTSASSTSSSSTSSSSTSSSTSTSSSSTSTSSSSSSSSTSTSTSTSTTSSTASTTTTSVPDTVTEPSTSTSSTTTTATEPTTTSSVAGTTTTTIVPATTSSVTVEPRAVTSTSVYPNATDLPSGQLPRTGSPSALLIAIGVVLIAGGLAISLVGYRRQRGRA